MSSPPSSKLMFLTKEILWGHSLEINEKDENLLSQINDLAIKLKEGGISITRADPAASGAQKLLYFRPKML